MTLESMVDQLSAFDNALARPFLVDDNTVQKGWSSWIPGQNCSVRTASPCNTTVETSSHDNSSPSESINDHGPERHRNYSGPTFLKEIAFDRNENHHHHHHHGNSSNHSERSTTNDDLDRSDSHGEDDDAATAAARLLGLPQFSKERPSRTLLTATDDHHLSTGGTQFLQSDLVSLVEAQDEGFYRMEDMSADTLDDTNNAGNGLSHFLTMQHQVQEATKRQHHIMLRRCVLAMLLLVVIAHWASLHVRNNHNNRRHGFDDDHSQDFAPRYHHTHHLDPNPPNAFN